MNRKLIIIVSALVVLAVAVPVYVKVSHSGKNTTIAAPVSEQPKTEAVQIGNETQEEISTVVEPKAADTAVQAVKEEEQTSTAANTSTTNTKPSTTTTAKTTTTTTTTPKTTTTTTTTAQQQSVTHVYGNTSGNLTNGGTAISDGKYTFYLNSADGFKLYRSNIDGSSKIKILDSSCSALNIVGEWVYYNTGSGIYKMKKDGSSRTQIVSTKTMGIAVVTDWIYYLERSGSNGENQDLYKIKTDGSSKTKINIGDGSTFVCIDSQALVVIEDWVYLSLLNKSEAKTELCRVKIDGSQVQKVLNNNSRFYSIADGWVYYADNSYRNINKAKVDGTGVKTIYTIPDENYAIYSVNASNGYVYFTNAVEGQNRDKLGIYKIKTDGSGLSQLLTGSSKFLNIAAGWIYFEALSSSTTTYSNGTYKVSIGGSAKILRLKTDGSELFEID